MASSAQIKNFISVIGPIIQKMAKANGYSVCSTTIAQACIESGYGLSGLAKYHNYFGLKCGKNWVGPSVNMKTKEEYKPGVLTTIKDNFRAYNSMEEGVAGYYKFISTPRYANLKTAKSAEEFAKFLKADGYATDNTYVSKLVSFVNKYDLARYDTGSPIKLDRTVKKGSRNVFVIELQNILIAKGYLAENENDGIFGKKTDEAVRAYQADHNLIVDGIVGAKTWKSLGVSM